MLAGIALMGLLCASVTAAEDDVAAERIVRAWVDEANQIGPIDADARDSGVARAALPPGTRLDRVLVRDGASVVYLELPKEFLDALDPVTCEQIVREQVARLKEVQGLSAFMILARPQGDPSAPFRPLPEYLPPPAAPLDKPEDGMPRAGGLPSYNPGKPVGALSGKTVFLSPGHGWYYSSTLGRWATQRGNNFGVVEDLSNGEAVLLHLARYLHNAGANVWPCRERDFNTNMIVVDNSDPAPSFSVTGSWPNSTSSGTWVGTDYQYHAVSTTETAVATYAPSFPTTDAYAVYVWTPSASNRATDARVRVNHTGGTTEHVVNMQRDGNTWRFLGHYHFNSGRDAARGSVEISNQGSDPAQFVIADAVRFGGGFGDYVDGGTTSGWPRWEESGRYFANFMGQPGTPYDTVSAMPRYAKWESESWEDSIYVSWHTNASTGSGHGTDVYVYAPGQPPPGPFGNFGGVQGSDTLATRIFNEIINDLRAGWNDPNWPGHLYSAYFGELNPNNNDEMPACLIEVAYHDAQADAESIADPRFRDMVARATYQGIVKWWFNHADGPNSSPTPNQTLLPEPPTHLTVRNLGNGTVRVSWRPPPSNSGNGFLGDPATGYIVQVSEDGYGFNNGTATTSTSMDVSGLPAGAIRYFRVIATNAGGQSFPSEIGGVKVHASQTSQVLVVNGFDRLDRAAMLAEDDPYDSDPMLRERPERMNHYGYVRTFGAAIQPTGLNFDYCANEAARDGDVSLSAYDAVVWQCGEESAGDSTFDGVEQSVAISYLTSGGKLFLSGAEIGWDLDALGNGASFYNTYLKADYVADDANTYSVVGTAGSIFADIPAFSFDNGATIYNVDFPDVIAPIGGSSSAMVYVGGSGGTAGVTYSGTFDLVNLGFPFEAITSADRRADVMAAVLNYFGLDPNMPPITPEDVIVESRNAAGAVTPPPAYVESGAWANSSIKSSVAGLEGTGSRFITYDLPNFGTDNATFVPPIEASGKYEVFVTWAVGANCFDAQYTINHYLGSDVLLVDQIPDGVPGANANTWVSLGQYWFEAGQSVLDASANVSEETVSGKPHAGWNQRVYTDAAKWVFVAWWPDGDADGDGDTDADDFAGFPGCFTGPAGSYGSSACEVYDFELDGDVDLMDYAAFQESVTSE